MAQNITILGASYEDVPAVTLPATGGGSAVFYDPESLDIPPYMTMMSYGTSTWDEFIEAYKAKNLVYCKASSSNDPASGPKRRLAFMAYVNDETNPTEVEFQYYRSVATHTNVQQGDQVYVYKLSKTGGWSVIVRESYSKIVPGTGLSSSYSNSAITLTTSLRTRSVTLSASNWSNDQNTVSVIGVTALGFVMTMPAPSSAIDWAASDVMCTAQGEGTLTFSCSAVPTSNITVNVLYTV